MCYWSTSNEACRSECGVPSLAGAGLVGVVPAAVPAAAAAIAAAAAAGTSMERGEVPPLPRPVREGAGQPSSAAGSGMNAGPPPPSALLLLPPPSGPSCPSANGLGSAAGGASRRYWCCRCISSNAS